MKNVDETNLELPPNKKRKRMKQKAKSKDLQKLKTKQIFCILSAKKLVFMKMMEKNAFYIIRRQINSMFQKYKLILVLNCTISFESYIVLMKDINQKTNY